jgi:hypothetical protein
MATGSTIFEARYLDPPVPCPNCGDPARGFAGSRTVAVAPGVRPAVVFDVYPCMCQVDDIWAGAFAAEVRRRKDGQPPRDVRGMSDLQREEAKRQVESQLAACRSRRDAAALSGMVQQVEDLDRQAIRLVQQLCRIIPGEHNRLRPIEISKVAVEWARQRNLVLPPRAAGRPDRRVALADIQTALAAEADYAHWTVARVHELARAIYQELIDFATQGRPVSPRSIGILAKIVPDADLLAVAAAEDGTPASDPDPVAQYARTLAGRRKRRITQLGTRQPTEDEDDYD